MSIVSSETVWLALTQAFGVDPDVANRTSRAELILVPREPALLHLSIVGDARVKTLTASPLDESQIVVTRVDP